MPLPESKSKALVDLLNRLAEEPNEFQLARAKKEANALLAVNASEGYTLLGIIAAIEENASEIRRNHRLAVLNAPNEWWVHENYAKSLFKLGYFKEAGDLASQLADQDPTDLDILRTAIGASLRAGKLGRANRLYEAARKLNYDDEIVEHNMEVAHDVQDFLKTADITEAVLERAVSIAEAIAHESNALIDDARVEILADESSFLSFMLTVKRPAELAQMSLRLVDRLVSEVADFPADRVSVGYLPASLA